MMAGPRPHNPALRPLMRRSRGHWASGPPRAGRWFAALLGIGIGALGATGRAPAQDLAAAEQHAEAVSRAVAADVLPVPSEVDKTRFEDVRTYLETVRARGRQPVAVVPLARREVVREALENNLPLSVVRIDPERIGGAIQEAEAVFDPEFFVALNYTFTGNRERTRVGLVNKLSFQPFFGGADPRAFELPITGDSPAISVIGFNSQSRQFGVTETITANENDEHGEPDHVARLSLGVSQRLPWGGDLAVSGTTTYDRVYYRRDRYYDEGDTTTDLFLSLSTPLPFTSGFGEANADNTAIAQAKLSKDASLAEIDLAVNELLNAVDVAYFELVRQIERFRVTGRNLELVERQRERMGRLFEFGEVTRLEVAQLEAERARALTRLEQGADAVLTASTRLAELIAPGHRVASDQLLFPIAFEAVLQSRVAVDQKTAVATALENRPELRVQDVNRAIDALTLANRRNSARPNITADLSLGVLQNGSEFGHKGLGDSLNNLFNPDTFTQDYTFTYRYPLAKVAERARVDIAELNLRSRDLTISDVRQLVRTEVSTALSSLQSARARYRLATREADAVRRAYQGVERQSGLLGSITSDEITDTLRRLLDAELSQVDALVQTRQAETAYLRALGVLAGRLPVEEAVSELDRQRLQSLASTGRLRVFRQVPEQLALLPVAGRRGAR